MSPEKCVQQSPENESKPRTMNQSIAHSVGRAISPDVYPSYLTCEISNKVPRVQKTSKSIAHAIA